MLKKEGLRHDVRYGSFAGMHQPTPMSASPQEADVAAAATEVSYGPLPDSCIAAKQRYSITSSDGASSLSGMVRPSIFAITKLMTNFNFVCCCTGMSAVTMTSHRTIRCCATSA